MTDKSESALDYSYEDVAGWSTTLADGQLLQQQVSNDGPAARRFRYIQLGQTGRPKVRISRWIANEKSSCVPWFSKLQLDAVRLPPSHCRSIAWTFSRVLHFRLSDGRPPPALRFGHAFSGLRTNLSSLSRDGIGWPSALGSHPFRRSPPALPVTSGQPFQHENRFLNLGSLGAQFGQHLENVHKLSTSVSGWGLDACRPFPLPGLELH